MLPVENKSFHISKQSRMNIWKKAVRMPNNYVRPQPHRERHSLKVIQAEAGVK